MTPLLTVLDSPDRFEIFLMTQPGLEVALAREVEALALGQPRITTGGVTIEGGWPIVWRANLECRGAGRVLVRLARFPAHHPAQLDKRARKIDWRALIGNTAVHVEATSRKSKIYHKGAARDRVAAAISDAGIQVGKEGRKLLVRIDDNIVTISIDTSGEALHKRGFKTFIAKAAMRENMAAMFLYECGYDGAEAVYDPMCGSGTFVIEAAEIAAAMQPGRARSFSFEALPQFDNAAFQAMKTPATKPSLRFFGSDRDQGAVQGATQNAVRAGVGDICEFSRQSISDIAPPAEKGLVILNPPYGARIGNKKPLYALYGSLGAVLKERFHGWRVGIITSDAQLANATGLTFLTPSAPVDHGGIKIRLYQTATL